jgi:hypothetical protein
MNFSQKILTLILFFPKLCPLTLKIGKYSPQLKGPRLMQPVVLCYKFADPTQN